MVHDTALFHNICVIPAKAGIQGPNSSAGPWTPAFAGVTIR